MQSNDASPASERTQPKGLDALAAAVLSAHAAPEHEPIRETRASSAPRARLSVAITASRKRADHRTERARSLELGRSLIEGYIDLERGIRLWRRALTLEFDPRIQRELARRLRILGRHEEAGDLLRSGNALDETIVAAALREAANAYAASGNAKSAATALREAANLEPTEAATLAQLATISAWAPDVVEPLDASNALTQAASRSKPGSAKAARDLARAFATFQKNARAAQDYANLLASQGRLAAADVVWRQHAVAAKNVGRIAEQRVATALNRNTPALALLAALDGCIGDDDAARLELLCSVLEHPTLRSVLSDDGGALVKLSAAATVKSSMGRATAFQSVAESLNGNVRAIIRCLAAEAFLAAGNHRRAIEAAKEACAEAPQLAHPHAVILAMAAEGANLPGVLIEHAIGLLPASADNYRVAATHFASENAHLLALAYCRQWLALAPGDENALKSLLEHALATNSADALAEALNAACNTTIPVGHLADEVRRGLESLLEIDSTQASEVARRLTEIVGATEEMLWPTLHAVALAANDEPLQVGLLCGSACDPHLPTHRAAELRLSVATHLSRRSDWQAAAEHLRHAARFNIDDSSLDSLLHQIREQQESSDWATAGDGLLALAHTEALVADRRKEAHAAQAWRQLGALRWDLAQHGEGAEDAFYRACTHAGEHGPFIYLSDLVDRLGTERALKMAVARTERDATSSDASMRAELLTWVARLAMSDSQHDAALTAALRSIELAPQAPRIPLAVIEQLCTHPRAADVIERAYSMVAKAALGATGKKTVTTRAERWRDWFDGQGATPAQDTSLDRDEPPRSAPSSGKLPSRRPPRDDDGLSLRGLVWGDSVPPPPVAPKSTTDRGLHSLAWGSRPPVRSDTPPPSTIAPDSEPPPEPSSPETERSVPLAQLKLGQTQTSTPPSSRSAAPFVEPAPRSEIPGPASEPPPHVSWAPQANSPTEEALIIELSAGSYQAGETLVTLYERDGQPRLRDIVAVRRLQAMQRRGNRDAIVQLRDAASANDEKTYVQAIEHILGVLDGETVTAPAVTALRRQPAITSTLLTGDLESTVNEALGIVWHSGLMRRDVGDYELSGTDRVPIGSSTTVGHIFSALGSVIDLSGMRLFHRNRDAGPLQSQIALVNPLAVILSGSAKRATRTLRFRIGQAVAAAMPPLALTVGLTDDQLTDLLVALRTGFGPVGRTSAQNITAAQMRIAQDLWQVISPDGERRLRHICSDVETISPSYARDNAKRIQRRLGLFASGDLYVALTETAASLDIQGGMSMLRAGDPDAWNHPAVADLFDIAIAPQFAAARWQTII